MKRIWLKIIALFTAVTFIFPWLSWAFEPGLVPLAPHVLTIQYKNSSIEIPARLGSIEKAFQGQNKTIIHIQDLHCNHEVQRNIAKIIDLVSRQTVRARHAVPLLVGEEGAFYSPDVTSIRRFPIPAIREAVSDYFVKQGKITGAEYYAGTGQYPIRLEGIETPKLYNNSLAAVRSFLNAESQGYVMDLREMLDNLKSRIYNRKLLALDKARIEYREGKLDVLAYATKLKNFAERFLGEHRSPLRQYPNLENYLHLGKKLFQPGVEPDQLFREMDELDHALRESLYTTNLQRELDRQYHRLDVIEKLLNISASQAELREFRQEQEKFKIGTFVEFIQTAGNGPRMRKAQRDRSQQEIDSGIYALDHYLTEVEKFYRLADIRSQHFVTNILKKMDAGHQNLAVIITGGFHTAGILSELKKQHIGYVTIKPRLTKQDAANPYFSILQGKKLPIEKLLDKHQTLIAPRSSLEQPQFRTVIWMDLGAVAKHLLAFLKSGKRDKLEKYLAAFGINKMVAMSPEDAKGLGIQIPKSCEVYSARIMDERTGGEKVLPVLLADKIMFNRDIRAAVMARDGGAYQSFGNLGLAFFAEGGWVHLNRVAQLIGEREARQGRYLEGVWKAPFNEQPKDMLIKFFKDPIGYLTKNHLVDHWYQPWLRGLGLIVIFASLPGLVFGVAVIMAQAAGATALASGLIAGIIVVWKNREKLMPWLDQHWMELHRGWNRWVPMGQLSETGPAVGMHALLRGMPRNEIGQLFERIAHGVDMLKNRMDMYFLIRVLFVVAGAGLTAGILVLLGATSAWLLIPGMLLGIIMSWFAGGQVALRLLSGGLFLNLKTSEEATAALNLLLTRPTMYPSWRSDVMDYANRLDLASQGLLLRLLKRCIALGMNGSAIYHLLYALLSNAHSVGAFRKQILNLIKLSSLLRRLEQTVEKQKSNVGYEIFSSIARNMQPWERISAWLRLFRNIEQAGIKDDREFDRALLKLAGHAKVAYIWALADLPLALVRAQIHQDEIAAIIHAVAEQSDSLTITWEIKHLLESLPAAEKVAERNPDAAQTSVRRLERSIIKFEGGGSGFVAYETTTHFVILTNTHVIRFEDNYPLYTRGPYSAYIGKARLVLKNSDVVHTDEEGDLAILTISKADVRGGPLVPLPIAASFSDGDPATLVSGEHDHISSGRLVTAGANAILLGAHTISGDSGSPYVVDRAGQSAAVAINHYAGPQGLLFTPALANRLFLSLIGPEVNPPFEIETKAPEEQNALEAFVEDWFSLCHPNQPEIFSLLKNLSARLREALPDSDAYYSYPAAMLNLNLSTDELAHRIQTLTRCIGTLAELNETINQTFGRQFWQFHEILAKQSDIEKRSVAWLDLFREIKQDDLGSAGLDFTLLEPLLREAPAETVSDITALIQHLIQNGTSKEAIIKSFLQTIILSGGQRAALTKKLCDISAALAGSKAIRKEMSEEIRQPDQQSRLRQSIVNLEGSSGFVVGETADHYILLTNAHVVFNEDGLRTSMEVSVGDRKLGSARVVVFGTKSHYDVAVLTLPKSEGLKGSLVPLTVGGDFGDGHLATLVSGANDIVSSGHLAKVGDEVFLMGAQSQPGDSGSPYLIRNKKTYQAIAITAQDGPKGILLTPALFRSIYQAIKAGTRRDSPGADYHVVSQDQSELALVAKFLGKMVENNQNSGSILRSPRRTPAPNAILYWLSLARDKWRDRSPDYDRARRLGEKYLRLEGLGLVSVNVFLPAGLGLGAMIAFWVLHLGLKIYVQGRPRGPDGKAFIGQSLMQGIVVALYPGVHAGVFYFIQSPLLIGIFLPLGFLLAYLTHDRYDKGQFRKVMATTGQEGHGKVPAAKSSVKSQFSNLQTILANPVARNAIALWLETFPNEGRGSIEGINKILTDFAGLPSLDSEALEQFYDSHPLLLQMHSLFEQVANVPTIEHPACVGKEALLRPYVSGPVVVNIGAGLNILGERLKKFLPGIKRAIGVDIEEQRKPPLPQGIEFKHMPDPSKIPLENNLASTALATFVLHHVDVPMTPYLMEVNRILDENGRFLVLEDGFSMTQTPVLNDPATGKIMELFNQLPGEDKLAFLHFVDYFIHHFVNRSRAPLVPGNYHSLEDWRSLFENAGFLVEKAEYLGLAKLGSRNPVPRIFFVLRKPPAGPGNSTPGNNSSSRRHGKANNRVLQEKTDHFALARLAPSWVAASLSYAIHGEVHEQPNFIRATYRMAFAEGMSDIQAVNDPSHGALDTLLQQAMPAYFNWDKTEAAAMGELGRAMEFTINTDKQLRPWEDKPVIYVPRLLISWYLQGGVKKLIAGALITAIIYFSGWWRYHVIKHWRGVLAAHRQQKDPMKNAADLLAHQVFHQVGLAPSALLQDSYEVLIAPYAGRTTLSPAEEEELKVRLKLLRRIAGGPRTTMMSFAGKEMGLPLPADNHLSQSIIHLLRGKGIKLGYPSVLPRRKRPSFLGAV